MRLRLLKPGLRTLGPAIRTESERSLIDDDTRRLIRQWLASAEWKQLRLDVFARDGLRCQRSGIICSGAYPADDSPVANHKRPHRGDARLFWDIDNLETVTKQVHDKVIQSEEQGIPGGIWS